MLKVSIDFTNPVHKDIVVADGSLRNIIIDVSAVINGIYTQLMASSSASAEAFRTTLKKIIADPNGVMWLPVDGQAGFYIHTPEEEE